MFRKVILAVATFAVIAVAFAIYVWREEPGARLRRPPSPPGPRSTASRPVVATRPAAAQPALAYQWARIPPGQAPHIRVYDPKTGEARIVFQAREWHPVSETELHLKRPSARVLLPGGQLAYVRADEGQVKVSGTDTRNPNPKSGWFKGHVEIFIDRTRPEWRQQHPELAAPEQHPETIVKIWLEDASFDLDLARLESEGTVIVQGSQGSIEGQGLELLWSEVDRRLRRLRIKQGRRATVRSAGLGDVDALPAARPVAAAPTDVFEPPVLPPPARPAAQGGPASAPAGQIGFMDRQPARLREERVDTYQLVFRDHVVARQMEGVRVAGSLKGDVLTLLRDVGREERTAVEYMPGTLGTRPAPGWPPATAAAETRRARGGPDARTVGQSTIELAWTGEVLIEPVAPPDTQATESPTGPRRFHLRAEGSPAEMTDARQGRLACRTFEYHVESRQGWLTGTPDEPVVLNAGPDRQVLVEQRLFFDQKAGLARITGPGRMVSRRSGPAAATRPASVASAQLLDPSGEIEVSWQQSADILFETVQAAPSDAGAPGTAPRRAAYLKEAAFAGQVQAGLSDQYIAADRLAVTFLPPPPEVAATRPGRAANPLITGDVIGGAAPDHVTAAGSVRMTQQSTRQSRQQKRETIDTVTCEHLEIAMARDDTGRSFPKVGTASGHVVARQVVQAYLGTSRLGAPAVREIRADDEITLEMDSVPRPVSEQEAARLQEAGRRLGYTPQSPEWQAKVEELRHRRQLVRRRLVAHGSVCAHDTQQDLKNLAGQHLECTFDADQRIAKAFLAGSPDEPAQVEHDTFHIRGQNLSLDMATETVEVPGRGTLRFYSDQDIDGRPLENRIPVLVTWRDRMWLRGSQNIGSFEGEVRVTSENNLMETRELRLTFAPAPRAGAADAPADRPAEAGWAARLLGAVRPASRRSADSPLAPQRNRRLARADAVGNVVIVSSSYGPGAETLSGKLAAFVHDRMPALLRAEAAHPAEPDRSRLLSRIRLAGPQARIDLAASQLLVEGQGTLLVEDYRIPEAPGLRRPADAGMLSSSVVPTLDSLGPSHTLFTWQNAMTFLGKDNIATFDHNVTMRHRSGTEMVLYDRLESALKLDEDARRRITSRAASLTCDNLVAQFDTARSGGAGTGPSPLSRATGLKAFWARRDVSLVDREAKVQRSAWGSLIHYDNQSGDARINGTEQQPALLQAVDPTSGRLLVNWRGQEVTWNLKTGEIRTQKSQILAPGR